MRIAFMLTSLGIGGAERLVIALAERMRARGHAVMILVLLPRGAAQWSTDLEVVHLNLRKAPLEVAIGTARAARALRGFAADLLHCHNFHGNILGRMLKFAVPGVRVISTIHNVYEGGWARRAAYRLSDPLSHCTVAVCEATANRFISQRKCCVITNGIDTRAFAPDAERREIMRTQMGVRDEFVWISISRIVPAKDIGNLIPAFALAHAADPRCELWVAGEGNGVYARRMHSLAIELGVDASIRWLGLRRDIAALLDAADAFVLASAWEGMPLAIGEAMAMEKPVVATDVGGMRELVGECGMIVPAGDPTALARGLRDTMRATPADRKTGGEAARRRIVERFNIDLRAEAWEAMYLKVAAPRRRGRFLSN